MRTVILAVILAGASGQASECSHTTCEFKTITLPASIAAQIPGNAQTTKIMVIHHSNDESRCHAFDNVQNADGTWARNNGCDATKNACYGGVHCGLSVKTDTATCKCYREGAAASSKDGEMQHDVATAFAQSHNDTGPERNWAHDMSTIDASAATQHPSNVADAAHDPVPHFNGPGGSHAGGDIEHNPASALLQYNTKQGCGNDLDRCQHRTCFTLQVQDGAGGWNDVGMQPQTFNNPNDTASKVLDWRAFTSDSFQDVTYFPGLLSTKNPDQPLLFSWKNPGDDSGDGFLRACEYAWASGGMKRMGRFFLASACEVTSDSMGAGSCTPSSNPGSDSQFAGFLWHGRVLRTGTPPFSDGSWYAGKDFPTTAQLKDRATWQAVAVTDSPGVFKLKNRYRDAYLAKVAAGGGAPGFKLDDETLVFSTPENAALFRATPAAADAGYVATPTPTSNCCTASSCQCGISRTVPAHFVALHGADSGQNDYTNTGKTFNDAEEATKSWHWACPDGSPCAGGCTCTWKETAAAPVANHEVEGSFSDDWWSGTGSLSGSSSTLELGISKGCRYWEDLDQEKCFHADGVTESLTEAGAWGDFRMVKTLGLRFTGLVIPSGATVASARIRFTARKSDSSGSPAFKIRIDQTDGLATDQSLHSAPLKGIYTEDTGHAEDSGLRWKPVVPNVISLRSAQSTYGDVDWTISESWVQNQQYYTPDLSTLVQTAIDNNYDNTVLTFFMEPQNIDPNTDQNERRRAYSFKKAMQDSQPTYVPTLELTFA